jgi:hypothetical protein
MRREKRKKETKQTNRREKITISRALIWFGIHLNTKFFDELFFNKNKIKKNFFLTKYLIFRLSDISKSENLV